MNYNNDMRILDRLSAIAIKYNRNVDLAPKIIEKGSGLVAQDIIKIAKDAGVPIVQHREVVQILERCEVDSFIPVEAYALMAQVLSKILSYSKNEYD